MTEHVPPPDDRLAPRPQPAVTPEDLARRPLLCWLLAGDARLTVTSGKTGHHLTLRVDRAEPQVQTFTTSWYVWVREGENPDPDADRPEHDAGPLYATVRARGWHYAGRLVVTADYLNVVHTKATTQEGRQATRQVQWVLNQIQAGWDGTPLPAIGQDGLRAATTLRKSVRCSRCRRPLEDPESIALGMGPDCRTKEGW